MTLWGFLSFGLLVAAIFVIFVLYLNHKKSMKILELEALRLEQKEG